jgi:predicted nucleotidyltransferase
MIKMEQILALSEEIAREFRPNRIILFGSYAYGVPGEDSDIDILVVLPFTGKPTRKALEIVRKIKPMIPLDLIVRTPEVVSERIANNDWLMRDVMEKGQTLYEDNHA